MKLPTFVTCIKTSHNLRASHREHMSYQLPDDVVSHLFWLYFEVTTSSNRSNSANYQARTCLSLSGSTPTTDLWHTHVDSSSASRTTAESLLSWAAWDLLRVPLTWQAWKMVLEQGMSPT